MTGRTLGQRRGVVAARAPGGSAPTPPRRPPSPARAVIVVMPAYNAAKTLERTYADIPHELVDRIILVDDVSRDETVDIARQLGLDVIIHRQNLGYGGNQKTCYDAALAAGADVVVMLHPDYQYDATRIPDLIAPILAGEARPDARQPVPGRPAGGRHAALEVRQQPLPDDRRERRLRAPPVRVPHRPSGLLAAAPRADPVPPEQRRLRVRPGARSPRSSRPACAGGSARSPSRRATSRRRARSASSGASCTGSRRCGSSCATCSIGSASGAVAQAHRPGRRDRAAGGLSER